MPICVYAQRGCCSHHGGVVGCSSGGRQICADGTFSPSCTCTPIRTDVYGCTDSRARNYNPRATINNGTCVYDVLGCMDKEAKNYNENATKDDNSCEYYILGCTDSNANNYNKDDGSCKYDIKGCMDSSADNYNKNATIDDGSCSYPSKTETSNREIIGGLLTVGLAVGGYQAIKKYKKK